VKTAFYGEEVNWGRIVAAAGYSGAAMDAGAVDLWYEGVLIVRSGQGVGAKAEEEAQAIARRKEFTVRVSLGRGKGRALIHTCDLSHDYVSINASYKT
jgi:glutamate N-acetyltransferase/amino-acid N-acetyltransferase